MSFPRKNTRKCAPWRADGGGGESSNRCEIKWRSGDATGIDLVPTAPTVVRVHVCVQSLFTSLSPPPPSQSRRCEPQGTRAPFRVRAGGGEGMMAGEMAPDRPVINQRVSRPAFARSLKHVLIDRINSSTSDVPGGLRGEAPKFDKAQGSCRRPEKCHRNVARHPRGEKLYAITRIE